MKGFKHIFVRECKAANVKIKVGPRWHCGHDNSIEVPEQKSDFALFIGFHELGHKVLHIGKITSEMYDDLRTRIRIEQEADEWANRKMRKYGYPLQFNHSTHGLIALYLHQGGKMSGYEVKIEGTFIVLYKHGFEIFSHFVSQLPMHPCIY